MMPKACLADRVRLFAGLLLFPAVVVFGQPANDDSGPTETTTASAAATETAPDEAAPRPPLADELASRYGLDAWAGVGRVEFVFDVAVQTSHSSRSWVWEPRSDRVSYVGNDKSGDPLELTYSRGDLATANETEGVEPDATMAYVDRLFINDTYWLFFPLHLAWDEGMSITDDGMQPLPVAVEGEQGEGRRLTVTYGAEVGYTPGDRFELYLGGDGQIAQWTFTGTTGRKLSTIWRGHERQAGILVAREFAAPKMNFRIAIKDLKIAAAEVDSNAASTTDPGASTEGANPTTRPIERPRPVSLVSDTVHQWHIESRPTK